MKRMLILGTILVLAVGFAAEAKKTMIAQATEMPEPTVLVLMVGDITEASDIVWGIEEPQTDEEWQVIDDAALNLIETFKLIGTGATAGPHDREWAEDEKFQDYLQQEYEALDKIRDAIAAKDVDGVIDAGGDLYTPCEQCHLDYNPAVINQQL